MSIRTKYLIPHLSLATALLSAVPAIADTVLTAVNGSMVLEGELLSVDDETYKIRTDLGELFVRREFVICTGDGCPADTTVDLAASDEVVLRSDDGQIALNGTLIEITNTDYVIETASGILRVRREFAICEGASCPSLTIESDRFAVTVTGSVGAKLVTTIVGDYTAEKDFNLTQQLSSDGELPTLLVGNELGLEISRITLKQADTVDAIRALMNDESEFAITRQQVTPQMLSAQLGRQISDVNELLNEEIIGLDAISFVVSTSNGLDVISLEAARDILRGQITNWAQIGSADQEITLHMLEDQDGLWGELRSRGLVGEQSDLDATLHASADAFNAALENDPSGLGMIYRSQAEGVKALSLASSCNIFVDNSDFAIQTEEHPLALRWYQYSVKEGSSSDFAQNVAQFIPTDFGQKSIASRGLVTQQLQILPMRDQGARLLSTVLSGSGDRISNTVMRSYFAEASNARRISTSLRFLTGSSTLDSKAESDIGRISEVVRSSEYEGYEVLVFGFSDSYGAFDANLRLSERRANSVRDVLLRKNPGYLDENTVRSFGIGSIAPIGCNESASGREQNRRVEIWIRPRA